MNILFNYCNTCISSYVHQSLNDVFDSIIVTTDEISMRQLISRTHWKMMRLLKRRQQYSRTRSTSRISEKKVKTREARAAQRAAEMAEVLRLPALRPLFRNRSKAPFRSASQFLSMKRRKQRMYAWRFFQQRKSKWYFFTKLNRSYDSYDESYHFFGNFSDAPPSVASAVRNGAYFSQRRKNRRGKGV